MMCSPRMRLTEIAHFYYLFKAGEFGTAATEEIGFSVWHSEPG